MSVISLTLSTFLVYKISDLRIFRQKMVLIIEIYAPAR